MFNEIIILIKTVNVNGLVIVVLIVFEVIDMILIVVLFKLYVFNVNFIFIYVLEQHLFWCEDNWNI